MTTPFFCVALAYLLFIASKAPLALAQLKTPEGYNNRVPREQQARLEGWGARARAAHANSGEAFAPFAASVIIAHIGGADPEISSMLAISYLVARIAYIAAYLMDVHWLRTIIWSVGAGAIFGLMLGPWLFPA